MKIPSVLALALLPSLGSAFQESPFLPGSQGTTVGNYSHRYYGRASGLPSGWVRALLQTADGYVWAGTHNGLARFDGSRFTIFDTRNTPELASNDVRALAQHTDGSLWIGSTLGLTRLRPGRPGSFEAIPELRSQDVRAILEDHEGGL